MITVPPSAPEKLVIACLCAQWCRTCDDYLPLFQGLRATFPDAQLHWIDIEDDADLVEPIEVDNFPTLLIASHGQVQFFGVVTPHLDTLKRLILAHTVPAPAVAQPAEVTMLLSRLQGRVPL
jgi:thioredoxin 1